MMVTKHYIAIFLSLLLILLLTVCLLHLPSIDDTQPTDPTNTADPTNTGDPTNTADPTDSNDPTPGPVPQEELRTIEEYLNAVENNGFIGINEYNSPAKLQLLWVFCNGAGIGVEMDKWEKGEAETVLKALEWSEFHTPPIKIPRKAANALLLEKCGLSLNDWKNFPYRYVEAYDAYYYMPGEEMRFPVAVQSGQIDQNGQYIIHYFLANNCPPGDLYTVTLRKTGNGYQFISNIDEADNYDPYAVHAISPDKITVDGAEKTYKNTNITLSVPVDWLALEQHREDGTTYYFREPTIDRCQLTFSSTGSQFAIHRTEAEYLALLSGRKVENVKILSYGKENVSGYDCTKVAYSYTVDDIEYIGIWYDNVITGLCMYEFAIVYPAAESQGLAPILDAIVDSIVLQPY